MKSHLALSLQENLFRSSIPMRITKRTILFFPVQVNDSVFDISEGSVVRVSTHCDRCLKCTSDAPMLYLCIQAKENSLGGYTLDDAAITERVSLL